MPTERHYGPVIAAFAASSGAAAAAEAGRLLAELGGVVTRSRVGSDSYAVERALSAVADSYVEVRGQYRGRGGPTQPSPACLRRSQPRPPAACPCCQHTALLMPRPPPHPTPHLQARLVHAASGGEVLETMEVARAAVGARNLGLPAYAAQMRAALRLQDVQVGARGVGRGPSCIAVWHSCTEARCGGPAARALTHSSPPLLLPPGLQMAFQSFRQLRRMSLAPLSAVDDDLLAQLVLAVGCGRRGGGAGAGELAACNTQLGLRLPAAPAPPPPPACVLTRLHFPPAPARCQAGAAAGAAVGADGRHLGRGAQHAGGGHGAGRAGLHRAWGLGAGAAAGPRWAAGAAGCSLAGRACLQGCSELQQQQTGSATAVPPGVQQRSDAHCAPPGCPAGAAGPAVAAADAADAPPPEPLLVDGVPIDPVSLRALDAKGGELAVTRMGTRELRAELAARRAPVSGNKKELQKKVQVGWPGGCVAVGCVAVGRPLHACSSALLLRALNPIALLPPARPWPAHPQKLRAAEAGDPAAAEEKKAAEKGKKGKAEVGWR